MARLARIVVPHIPHHITQRGNRRQQTFFREQDYEIYLQLLSEWCKKCQVQIWAYCLMPNHVHLILVPEVDCGLALAVSETHRRYTRHVNFREGWRGHLWQGRFGSYPLDDIYLMAAVRYVELNPVKAGIAAKPEDYRWSSAASHVKGAGDSILTMEPLKRMIPDWKSYLERSWPGDEKLIERHQRTGRPLGDDGFIKRLEELTGRVLRKQRPGRRSNALVNKVWCPQNSMVG
jgi:putative transposase